MAYKTKIEVLTDKHIKEVRISQNRDKIGKIATFKFNSLYFKVKILDYKYEYGSDRYYISPIEGSGELWTSAITVDN